MGDLPQDGSDSPGVAMSAMTAADVDTFANAAAHDMHSAIRQMGMLAEWVLEDHRDVLATEAIDNLELIQQRAERLHRLTDAIATFAQIRAEAPQLANPAALVQQALHRATQEADTGGTVTVGDHTCPDELTFAAGAAAQALHEVLHNALWHPESPAVHMTMRHEDGRDDTAQLVIEVTSQGSPVPTDQLQRVFEPFVRLRPRDERDGNGLGLSIARRLAEVNGGRITMSSTEAATTVTMCWPTLGPDT